MATPDWSSSEWARESLAAKFVIVGHHPILRLTPVFVLGIAPLVWPMPNLIWHPIPPW